MAAKPWARLLSLDNRYTHIGLTSDTIRIGRKKSCTIVLDSNIISAEHCRIMKNSQGPGAIVEDCSLNGTFVDGVLIGKGKKTVITDGMTLSLVKKGKDELEFIFKQQGEEVKGAAFNCSGLLAEYTIVKGDPLGTGNFSVVKRGVHKNTGTQVAIKCINKRVHFCNYKTKEQIEREVQILRELSHENIIKVYDIFDEAEWVYIVLELATGGDLFESIQKRDSYTEQDAREVIKQILSALLYLHSKGIAHRDLKPENILLASNNSLTIKLTDFGLARIVSRTEMMTTLCGTPQYVAPEIVESYMQIRNGQAINGGGYGKEVDMWSTGVLIYVLLSGYPPFDDSETSKKSLFDQIRDGSYDFSPYEVWEKVSSEAKHLISRLMEVEVEKRLTVDEALKHPWILGYQNIRRPLSMVPNNIKTHQPLGSIMVSPIKKLLKSEPDYNSSDTEIEDNQENMLNKGKRNRLKEIRKHTQSGLRAMSVDSLDDASCSNQSSHSQMKCGGGIADSCSDISIHRKEMAKKRRVDTAGSNMLID